MRDLRVTGFKCRPSGTHPYRRATQSLAAVSSPQRAQQQNWWSCRPWEHVFGRLAQCMYRKRSSWLASLWRILGNVGHVFSPWGTPEGQTRPGRWLRPGLEGHDKRGEIGRGLLTRSEVSARKIGPGFLTWNPNFFSNPPFSSHSLKCFFVHSWDVPSFIHPRRRQDCPLSWFRRGKLSKLCQNDIVKYWFCNRVTGSAPIRGIEWQLQSGVSHDCFSFQKLHLPFKCRWNLTDHAHSTDRKIARALIAKEHVTLKFR